LVDDAGEDGGVGKRGTELIWSMELPLQNRAAVKPWIELMSTFALGFRLSSL
jgi:hypothetical protein